jgi:hypothetical protein
MTYDLKKLKLDYEKTAKKYSFPKFSEMNKRFEIEKLAGRETEMLVREIRRIMMEKTANYFKFTEIFINPGSAPMFFLTAIKKMNGIERKPLEELYVDLGKLEVEAISLESAYDEKKEAAFIKKVYKKWELISKKFSELMERVMKSAEQQSEKKERFYFG